MPTKKIGDLNPNPNNPRTITDVAFAALSKSLGKYGDLSGIIFNRTTGNLVGGHMRLKAFNPNCKIEITKEYNRPTNTGTIAEGYVLVNEERFAYREVEWEQTDETIANIAANKHGGRFDFGKLPDTLLSLDNYGTDMDLTGFDTKEIERIMTGFNKDNQGKGSGTDPPAGQATSHRCPKCGYKWEDS